jgi:hypothetical protein
MDDETDDELLLVLINSVAADVLERIGDDRERRYEFFRQYIDLAKRIVGSDS